MTTVLSSGNEVHERCFNCTLIISMWECWIRGNLSQWNIVFASIDCSNRCYSPEALTWCAANHSARRLARRCVRIWYMSWVTSGSNRPTPSRTIEHSAGELLRMSSLCKRVTIKWDRKHFEQDFFFSESQLWNDHIIQISRNQGKYFQLVRLPI